MGARNGLSFASNAKKKLQETRLSEDGSGKNIPPWPPEHCAEDQIGKCLFLLQATQSRTRSGSAALAWG